MKLGMAVVSRIVTGEEPCLRKVLYEIERPLPVDARVIQYKMEHELLVAKTIEELTGDTYVNEWVTRNMGGIRVDGKIDIVSIDNKITTIIEVKSGKEKESHHVQLWRYMSCHNAERKKGELRYNNTMYRYREADIPLNLWNVVFERTRPVLKGNLQQVKGSHCRYCKYSGICQKEVMKFLSCTWKKDCTCMYPKAYIALCREESIFGLLTERSQKNGNKLHAETDANICSDYCILAWDYR